MHFKILLFCTAFAKKIVVFILRCTFTLFHDQSLALPGFEPGRSAPVGRNVCTAYILMVKILIFYNLPWS